MESDKRNITLDIAKGIGILLVIIGHCIQMNSYIGSVIFSFHMPLFFVISGLCYNELKYTDFVFFIKKRIVQLVLPMFFFCSIALGIYYFLFNENPIDTLLQHGLISCTWFLLVLFITSICYFFISKLNKKLYWFVLCSIFIISMTITYCHIYLPFSLSAVPIAIVYYGLGNKLRMIRIPFSSCVAFSLSLALLFILYVYPIRMNIFYIRLESFLLSFCGIFTILTISSKLANSNFNEWFVYLGKNTLVIMCTHMIILKLCCNYLVEYMNNHLIYKIFEFIIVCCVSIAIAYFVDKKVPWIIGK